LNDKTYELKNMLTAPRKIYTAIVANVMRLCRAVRGTANVEKVNTRKLLTLYHKISL